VTMLALAALAAPSIWIPSERELDFRSLPREAREAALELFEETRAVMRRIGKAFGDIARFQWSNSGETSMWDLCFTNTNFAQAPVLQGSSTAGSFFIALHNASPGATGTQQTNETIYTNYTREAVARSGSGWTITGNNPIIAENAAAVTYPTGGATGDTLTYFSFGQETSGAGVVYGFGAMTSSLAVSNGITPSFAIDAMNCDFT
jgi:hypothetical protein